MSPTLPPPLSTRPALRCAQGRSASPLTLSLPPASSASASLHHRRPSPSVNKLPVLRASRTDLPGSRFPCQLPPISLLPSAGELLRVVCSRYHHRLLSSCFSQAHSNLVFTPSTSSKVLLSTSPVAFAWLNPARPFLVLLPLVLPAAFDSLALPPPEALCLLRFQAGCWLFPTSLAIPSWSLQLVLAPLLDLSLWGAPSPVSGPGLSLYALPWHLTPPSHRLKHHMYAVDSQTHSCSLELKCPRSPGHLLPETDCSSL